MTELKVLAFGIFMQTIATCMAIFVAGYLAFYGKDGWGWMIFLAICIGSTSFKYKNDSKELK